MAPTTKVAWANSLMVVGLFPYIIVLGFIAWTCTPGGNTSIGAAFVVIFGLGVSYIAAAVIALPASMWSRSLADKRGEDTRLSIVLRGAVTCGIFPPLAIFPFMIFFVLRS